ncbi:MAG: cellulase family glycosylhydrolase [Candidatus Sumerlaeota bacterium]|nr:cellulase family glycosylhydrolase [Candidatus Sumerlaeota bacterium]
MTRNRPVYSLAASILALALAGVAGGAGTMPATFAAPAPSPAPDAPAASRLQRFITRSGAKLMDGDKEFRFIGANMPGLILPYDWTLFLPERLTLPTPWEQEDGFKTLDQMNLRVVRLWNLPIRDPKAKTEGGKMTWHYVQGPGQFNDESFKVVDNILALANRYGVRVVFDFTAESGSYLGGIQNYAAHRGKKTGEFYTDPQLKEDYKATVRYVINRVNTITGVTYKEDKAILAWQFGNEMHSATTEWLAEMAAYIKSLDSNHLVAETRHRPGAPMVIDPNIDLYTRHLYGNYPGVGAGWPAACRKEVASLKGQRPMFIGEFGPYIDGKMFTHDNVVDKTREFLDYVRGQEGMAGAMIWSMYFHHQNGGFYWHQIMTYPSVWSYHWPGFPSADAQREQGVMNAMRETAFRIQGLPIAPVPAPGAPELLPIGETPLFSWRGSAGASGYDIERAPQAGGPWVVIANNVCDADVAYHPLFSDATARAGQTWFYRVIARNASGVSQPSNVVGPVQVKRVCLVDELQDFSRACAKSSSLTLTNDYNAVYAEYLFRAKAAANEWLAYRVPGAIESVSVVAFYNDPNAGPASELSLQVSPDGANYTDLKPERRERHLPSPPGGAAGKQKRVMVEYQAATPAGQRFVRIKWNGPAELDRVEIYHIGGGL